MKIPANAKKVFEGEIFSVYQWPQKMFDGTEQIFECLKRADSVNVIATQGDKILITDQEQPGGSPFIAPFGGRVDSGEDILHAAKRELLEEGGLESEEWTEIFQIQPYGKIDARVHTFVARNSTQTCQPHLDPGEKITVRKVPFEKFLTVVREDSFRSKELASYVMRMQLEGKTEELREKIFGK